MARPKKHNESTRYRLFGLVKKSIDNNNLKIVLYESTMLVVFVRSVKKPKTIIVPGINSPFEAEIAVTAGLYALDDEDVKLGYCRGGNPFVRSGGFSN